MVGIKSLGKGLYRYLHYSKMKLGFGLGLASLKFKGKNPILAEYFQIAGDRTWYTRRQRTLSPSLRELYTLYSLPFLLYTN